MKSTTQHCPRPYQLFKYEKSTPHKLHINDVVMK